MRNWLISISVVIWGAITVVLIVKIAPHLSVDWVSKNHEAIRNVGLILVAFYGLPFVVWRSILANRDTRTKQKEAHTNTLNQVGKTYTDAITQLGLSHSDGTPNIEIRLGGIYALEQLAKANEEYHPQIMEVLCGYVDTNASQWEIKFESGPDPDLRKFKPRVDIQTVLTVIGRRNSDFDKGLLSLSGANLRGVKLYEANLRGFLLKGVNFGNSSLVHVDFAGADLQDANFEHACISGANLEKSNLEQANFSYADMRGAILSVAECSGANFSNSNLRMANFYGAYDLSEALFDGAYMHEAVGISGCDIPDGYVVVNEQLIKKSDILTKDVVDIN